MKRILAAVLVLVLLAGGYFAGAVFGWWGEPEPVGRVAPAPRPPAVTAARRAALAEAAARVGAPPGRQILFGDLHVHSTYSMDAFLLSLPLLQGEGAHPPADACDFARFCSSLDFFSMTDHAEGLTPAMWDDTVESVRACNAVAGDAANPDLVAFLGWEWTQMGDVPAKHYGHKNVVLRDLAEGAVPSRPIAAEGTTFRAMRTTAGRVPLAGMALLDFPERQRYFDLANLRSRVRATPVCPEGVPERELPTDCSEVAATPRDLFAKLDDWGFAALVIPHGNAWGNTTPAGIDWGKQLANGQHDPERQRLIEVYSGHGNSEEYRPWRAVRFGDDGGAICPEPSSDFTPECHRAGEIVRSRCLAAGLGSDECDARAAQARRDFLAAGRDGTLTVPGATPEDWLDAGQCRDCFEPAFRYRPGGSSQYALAVTGAGVPGAPADARFRFGFIASSDNHTARPASGYKEGHVLGMTDAVSAPGTARIQSLLRLRRDPEPRSVPIEPGSVPALPAGEERLASFFYTGGLVAVHADGRSRDAIWDALVRKEVYGTSGPRILLWFDLLNGPAGGPRPMGSEVALAEAPRFRVRAVGSFVQKPGCPEDAVQGLSAERLASLCLGECYNPGDRRNPIERIEIVRIRPRRSADEDVAPLIEDPWRVFPCRGGADGCVVEFEDPEFPDSDRDAVYYARALQPPTNQVNGDNLRCEYDAEGRCVHTRPCAPDADDPDADTCLGTASARAWSSPIFVDRKR